MANGTNSTITPDPSIPDLGGRSVEDILGPRPPDPATAATGSSIPERYGKAALEGAAGALPIAGLQAVSGVGIPAALGTEAIGAFSGMADQLGHDLFPNTPWVGPAMGFTAGLGTGGFGPGVRAATSAVSHAGPLITGGAIGVGEALAHSILEGGMAHLSSLAPEALGAAMLYPAFRGAARFMAAPTRWGSLRGPVVGAMGTTGVEGTNWLQRQGYMPGQPQW